MIEVGILPCRRQQGPGLVERKAGSTFQASNVVGAEEQVNLLVEPELEV